MTFEESVLNLMDVVVHNGGAPNVNARAFNATFASSASKYDNVDPIIYNTKWRQNAYRFCNTVKYGTCSIIAINSYGYDVYDTALTEYMFLVQNGSCSEQFV